MEITKFHRTLFVNPETAGKSTRLPADEWHECRIKFAQEKIDKLKGNPNYISVVACLELSIAESLTYLESSDF